MTDRTERQLAEDWIRANRESVFVRNALDGGPPLSIGGEQFDRLNLLAILASTRVGDLPRTATQAEAHRPPDFFERCGFGGLPEDIRRAVIQAGLLRAVWIERLRSGRAHADAPIETCAFMNMEERLHRWAAEALNPLEYQGLVETYAREFITDLDARTLPTRVDVLVDPVPPIDFINFTVAMGRGGFREALAEVLGTPEGQRVPAEPFGSSIEAMIQAETDVVPDPAPAPRKRAIRF